MSALPSYPAQKVAPYDPAWPDLYAALAEPLRVALGPDWDLEHIGSTSVPGLPAKPVIDIAVRLPAGTRLGDHTARLNALGWTEPMDLGTHAAMTRLDGHATRRAIAHLFDASDWATAHPRLFARWLREHPSDRDAYAELKLGLVEAGVWGHAYTAAKGRFVEDVVNLARADIGLPQTSLSPRR